MSNFDGLFGDVYNSVATSIVNKLASQGSLEEYSNLSEGIELIPVGPQEEFILQNKIRPVFGKSGINYSLIGTHPDFICLENYADTQSHYICTMFIDIKGSTRLSLNYELDKVYLFKNAVIKTCIDVVRSFDGYVHRLMGDAVMAFFGGKDIEKEDAVANAINCSITLRAILEGSIKPWMDQHDMAVEDFGFRVGCDFGDDDDVLWGGFGFYGVGEVSATGLPVDMASKLQGLASKNKTMLGQGVLNFTNWPDKFATIKTRVEGGVMREVPFVTPNITYKDGESLDYIMRELSYERCLAFSALPIAFRKKLGCKEVKPNACIEYKCFTVEDEGDEPYISASRFLDANVDLKFQVEVMTNSTLSFPLKVVFIKTNHGPATPPEERDIEQKGRVFEINKQRKSPYYNSYKLYSTITIDEKTLYRGLHTMRCEVYDRNKVLLFKDSIGVMIK